MYKDKEVNKVVDWAVKFADKHNIGIQGVIASFISARDELCDIQKAIKFVENEYKNRGKGV